MWSYKEMDFGLVDEIVPEPLCGAHHDPVEAAQLLKNALLAALGSLKTKSEDELIAERYQKFRAYGRFFETPDSDLSSMRDNE